MKKILLSTGNDGQVDFAIKSRDSFLRHNYIDETVLISDNLSQPSINKLEASGWNVCIIPPENINDNYKSNVHPLGKLAKPFFVKCFLNTRPDLISNERIIIFSDPDILCQRNIDALIDNHIVCSNKVAFARQYDIFSESPHLWTRLNRAKNDGQINDEQFFSIDTEINTGFFLGKGNDVMSVVSFWSSKMLSQSIKTYMNSSSDDKNDAWHDQDYFRYLIRVCNDFYRKIFIFPGREVVHLCGNGWKSTSLFYSYSFNKKFGFKIQRLYRDLVTQEIPFIVHFAGASHRNRFMDYLYWEGIYEASSAFFLSYIQDLLSFLKKSIIKFKGLVKRSLGQLKSFNSL